MTNHSCSKVLLKNSFDFLEMSTFLLSKFSGSFKYIAQSEAKTSLISISTAVELLLKAKVASIDWKQVFKHPARADAMKIKTGDFYSVGFEECVERLEKLMGCELPKRIKDNINCIRIIRNKLIHYNFENCGTIFAFYIALGIDAFVEFYRVYIMEALNERKDRTKDLEQELFQVKEYVDVRLNSVKPKLQNLMRPKTNYFSECYNCSQDTLILKDKVTTQCLFCEKEDDIEDYALTISDLHGTTKVCPDCNLNSVIALRKIVPEEEQAWECILCGYYINRPQKWLQK